MYFIHHIEYNGGRTDLREIKKKKKKNTHTNMSKEAKKKSLKGQEPPPFISFYYFLASCRGHRHRRCRCLFDVFKYISAHSSFTVRRLLSDQIRTPMTYYCQRPFLVDRTGRYPFLSFP